MAFFKDVGKFEGFNLKRMIGKIKDDPERLFIGAGDKAGTMLWNKLTGKDYEPIVNEWGGASDDTYEAAEKAGIRTKSGRKMHDLAEIIASFYTGKWAGGKLGGMAGGGSGGSAGGTQVPNSVNLVNAGGEMSTGSAGTYGSGGLNVSPSSMSKWGQMMNNTGSMVQQQEQQPAGYDLAPTYAEELRYDDPYASQYGYSSKRLKNKRGGAKGSSVAKALHSRDPIDKNGAEIATIQALTRELDEAKRKLAALKKARGRS